MMFFKGSQGRWRSAALVTGTCFVAMAFAAPADATCLGPKMPQQPAPARFTGAHLAPAVYHPADQAPARFVRVNEPELWPVPASIVGLWQFQFTGPLPDYGTQAWHADGTELMFSGGQNPATGDVCQGVWKQIGPRTYTLSHVAFGWAGLELQPVDPTKGDQFARIHFHFIITLDSSGDKFTGTYSASIYAETEADPFNEDPSTNPPVATVTGNVTATRVQPDR